MKLPNTAKKIQGSINHWADIDGTIYCIDGRHKQNKLIKKSQNLNQGYYYIGIRYPSGIKSKRVHRIIAELFIPNPKNYSIVGHKNNIKTDNRVENLYWTTIKENTKKAYADGLAKTAKGFEDNQSMPVRMYDTATNQFLREYGSIIEASKKTGIGKSTIARQAKYKRPIRKPYYFRYVDDETVVENDNLIGMFDYSSDKLISTYISSLDAHNKTGYEKRLIDRHIKENNKPTRKVSKHYFLQIKSK